MRVFDQLKITKAIDKQDVTDWIIPKHLYSTDHLANNVQLFLELLLPSKN